MDDETVKNHVLAGKVLGEMLRDAKKKARPGASLFDLAEEMERKIMERGKEEGKDIRPAFPVNLSLDEVAAHATPAWGNEETLPEKGVLKIDCGVCVEGRLADSAVTIDLGNEWGKLLDAADKALENALSVVKVGIEVRKIGAEIEAVATGAGYAVVRNLSGHGLAEWDAHVSPTIPNYDNRDPTALGDGMAIAIEPFLSTGRGIVHDAGNPEIFGLEPRPAPVRDADARKIVAYAERERRLLPFSAREIERVLRLGEFKRRKGLRELLQRRAVHGYPPLADARGSVVAQAETCLLLLGNDVKVLVKP